MANVTYAFNSTIEFYASFLKNLSYAFGGGSHMGIFMWAFGVFLVHKTAGFRASVPAGAGFAILLANAGMLPAWVSPLVIMTTSVAFAIVVYEHTLARRR